MTPPALLQRNILRLHCAEEDARVGTGFVLPGGWVATCAHVVSDALDNTKNFTEAAPVGELRAESACGRVSAVLKVERRLWGPVFAQGLPQIDGDFALLRMVCDAPPDGFPTDPPEAKSQDGVWCYGFPCERGDEISARIKRIELSGPDHTWPIEKPDDWVREARRGFSGAPVFLHGDKSAPVGMVVERETGDHTDRRVFIIPMTTIAKAHARAMEISESEARSATRLTLVDTDDAFHANADFGTGDLIAPRQLADPGQPLAARFQGSFGDPPRDAPRLWKVEVHVETPEHVTREAPLGRKGWVSCGNGVEARQRGSGRRVYWEFRATEGDLHDRNVFTEAAPLFEAMGAKEGDLLRMRMCFYATQRSMHGEDPPEHDDVTKKAEKMKERIIERLRLKAQGEPREDGSVTLSRLTAMVREFE